MRLLELVFFCVGLTLLCVSTPTAAQDPNYAIEVFIAQQVPFVREVVEDGGVRYEGFDVDLWSRIFSRLALDDPRWTFTYTLVQKSEVVERVRESNAVEAVGIASVAIDPSLEDVRFSHVYFHSGLDAIVLRRNTEINIFLFTAPFTMELWISATLLLFFSGIVIWFFEKRIQPKEFPRTFIRGINEGIWYCWGVLVKSQGRDLKGLAARMYSISFSTLAIIFVAAYTANLASILIVEQLRSDIDDVSQLNGEIIGVVNATAGEAWARNNLPDSPILSYPSGIEAWNGLVSDQTGAFIFDAPSLLYFKNTRDFRDRYQILGTRLTADRFAMVLKGNSSIVDQVNGALISTFEDGYLEDLRSIWFKQQFSSLLPNGVENLSLISVSGLAVPFVVSLAAAIVSYIFIRCNPGI